MCLNHGLHNTNANRNSVMNRPRTTPVPSQSLNQHMRRFPSSLHSCLPQLTRTATPRSATAFSSPQMLHNFSLRRPISAPSSPINYNQSATSLHRLTTDRLRNNSVTAVAHGIHSQAPVALRTFTLQRAWPRFVPRVMQHLVHMSPFLSQPQGPEHLSEQTDEARPEQPTAQSQEPSRQLVQQLSRQLVQQQIRQPVQPPSELQQQPSQRPQSSVASSDDAQNRQRNVFSHETLSHSGLRAH